MKRLIPNSVVAIAGVGLLRANAGCFMVPDANVYGHETELVALYAGKAAKSSLQPKPIELQDGRILLQSYSRGRGLTVNFSLKNGKKHKEVLKANEALGLSESGYVVYEVYLAPLPPVRVPKEWKRVFVPGNWMYTQGKAGGYLQIRIKREINLPEKVQDLELKDINLLIANKIQTFKTPNEAFHHMKVGLQSNGSHTASPFTTSVFASAIHDFNQTKSIVP